jgi:hypothetical protein
MPYTTRAYHTAYERTVLCFVPSASIFRVRRNVAIPVIGRPPAVLLDANNEAYHLFDFARFLQNGNKESTSPGMALL